MSAKPYELNNFSGRFTASIDTGGPAFTEPDSGVKATSTPNRRSKRPRRDVETSGRRGFLAAAQRFIRAAGRRAGEGDEFELAELVALRGVLEEAIAEAVQGQRAYGKSWAKIGAAVGTTREAAWQRWGRGSGE